MTEMKRKERFVIPSCSKQHSEDPIIGDSNETLPPSQLIEGGTCEEETQADIPPKKKAVRGPSKGKILKDGEKLPEPKLLNFTFVPDSVKTQATVAIKSNMPRAHLSWTEWSTDQITTAWDSFQVLYNWSGDNLEKSKEVFYNYANNNYRKWMKRARDDSLKFENPRQHPPPYMSVDIWQQFWDEWEKTKYKTLQITHKQNRASENMVLHTCGSHSFEQIKLKLAKGGNPEDVDPIELFEVTHKRANNDYPSQRARNIVETAKAIRQELQEAQQTQVAEGLTPKPIDLKLDCLAPAAGGIRKGALIGFPGEKFRKRRGEGSAFIRASYLTREQHDESIRAQKEEYEEKIKEALQTQKVEYEDKIKEALQAQKVEYEEKITKVVEAQREESRNQIEGLTSQLKAMNEMLLSVFALQKG